jgi:acyl carrier protein
VTSQSATNPSRDNYKKADKSKDPPACPKFQESVDSVDNNTASAEVALYSVDVEETVNEFAKEASCEINREEFNSVEAEETVDQLANQASREINREELSSVRAEQGETIEANELSCELYTYMNDPALYIHSIEKRDLATRKRLISLGPFQPKAHEMNEKQFSNESLYHIKVGKNNFKRKWLSYSPKEDAVFCHFCIFLSQ